jgi:hypothetical protein
MTPHRTAIHGSAWYNPWPSAPPIVDMLAVMIAATTPEATISAKVTAIG